MAVTHWRFATDSRIRGCSATRYSSHLVWSLRGAIRRNTQTTADWPPSRSIAIAQSGVNPRVSVFAQRPVRKGCSSHTDRDLLQNGGLVLNISALRYSPLTLPSKRDMSYRRGDGDARCATLAAQHEWLFRRDIPRY